MCLPPSRRATGFHREVRFLTKTEVGIAFHWKIEAKPPVSNEKVRNVGIRLTTRKEDAGYRVWLIETGITTRLSRIKKKTKS
jgi:hypothetical protein